MVLVSRYIIHCVVVISSVTATTNLTLNGEDTITPPLTPSPSPSFSPSPDVTAITTSPTDCPPAPHFCSDEPSPPSSITPPTPSPTPSPVASTLPPATVYPTTTPVPVYTSAPTVSQSSPTINYSAPSATPAPKPSSQSKGQTNYYPPVTSAEPSTTSSPPPTASQTPSNPDAWVVVTTGTASQNEAELKPETTEPIFNSTKDANTTSNSTQPTAVTTIQQAPSSSSPTSVFVLLAIVAAVLCFLFALVVAYKVYRQRQLSKEEDTLRTPPTEVSSSGPALATPCKVSIPPTTPPNDTFFEYENDYMVDDPYQNESYGSFDAKNPNAQFTMLHHTPRSSTQSGQETISNIGSSPRSTNGSIYLGGPTNEWSDAMAARISMDDVHDHEAAPIDRSSTMSYTV